MLVVPNKSCSKSYFQCIPALGRGGDETHYQDKFGTLSSCTSVRYSWTVYSEDPLESVFPSGTLEAEVSFIQPDHKQFKFFNVSKFSNYVGPFWTFFFG